LTQRGHCISTVKHAHHAFDIDQEGRDSWRHRHAGASEVAIVSANRWALVHELRGAPEPALQDVVDKLAPCDLVLTEGYKWENHPKIEVRNLDLAHPELADKDSTVIAIAANGVIENSPVPVFDRENVKAIADFIVERMGLAGP
ncbi:MAG: molybdopterin-guanine dinucleotide biosynthesis protein B, partial [Aestuariivirgaceae bacterium]